MITMINLLRKFGEQGRVIINTGREIKDPKKRLEFFAKAVKKLKQDIEHQKKYKEVPVDFETFMFSPDYLGYTRYEPETDENEGNEGGIFPVVFESAREIVEGEYIEAVLTGGIGVAKTSLALLVLAYDLYLVSILRDPHKEYGLLKSDEIVFIFQSLNATHAKTVDYGRFKAIIDASPYFKNKFPFDKNIDSELQFPNRVYVRPVSGSSKAAIGQNIFGGMLDEVNFMAVTERSKNSKEKGTYDQAWENYTSLVRRRKSRFMKRGKLPGTFCLVSSKRYPGEFTDVKMEEAKTNPLIYVYDKKEWEVKPADKYTGEYFNMFIGDLTRKPRILEDKEEVAEQDKHLILPVPVEYYNEFKQDPIASLRDIGGVSTLAMEPFILDVENVAACFGSYTSIMNLDKTDFVTTKLKINPSRIKRKEEPRFIHVDLSLSGDSTGLACGYVSGFKAIKRGEDHTEVLPIICIDFILEIRPPPNGEIDFSKVRKLIYTLTNLGMNIKWVSYDSYQSVDSLQILKKKGYKVGLQSVDKTPKPYYLTKAAYMDGRVYAPEHSKCYIEVVSLERDPKTGKIDHPPNSSKDVSDSVCAVVYGLTMRKEIWIRHGVSLVQIPDSLREASINNSKDVDNYGSIA